LPVGQLSFLGLRHVFSIHGAAPVRPPCRKSSAPGGSRAVQRFPKLRKRSFPLGQPRPPQSRASHPMPRFHEKSGARTVQQVLPTFEASAAGPMTCYQCAKWPARDKPLKLSVLRLCSHASGHGFDRGPAHRGQS
jgi:hypothetical protein